MAFTFFFRDSQTLELAIEHCLPVFSGRAFIHVWDAGCAHGPEPYTLAILLRERMSDYIFRNVRIHATDVDPMFAEQVRSGVFPEGETQRIPRDIFAKYFRPASRDGHVEIVPELREKVTFSRHDLLTLSPPREGFSLIVCKNVLLHFDEARRIDVLRMFHESLQPGGVLVMEQTQKTPEPLSRFFRQVAPHASVHERMDPAFVGHSSEAKHAHRHAHRRVDSPEKKSPSQHGRSRSRETTA